MRWIVLGSACLFVTGLAGPASATRLVGAEFVAAGGSWSGPARLEAALGQALPPGTAAAGSTRLQLGGLAWGFVPAALGAPWLDIQPLGGDLALAWSSVPGATRYRVWSGSSWPGTPVLLLETPDTQWLDAGAAAADARRWYRVTALNTPLEETR
ncbi:MAG: hypothetical protein WC326_09690 [Candidatus Delongbacteria bacterium]